VCTGFAELMSVHQPVRQLLAAFSNDLEAARDRYGDDAFGDYVGLAAGMARALARDPGLLGFFLETRGPAMLRGAFFFFFFFFFFFCYFFC
jgi:hypothetical protein